MKLIRSIMCTEYRVASLFSSLWLKTFDWSIEVSKFTFQFASILLELVIFNAQGCWVWTETQEQRLFVPWNNKCPVEVSDDAGQITKGDNFFHSISRDFFITATRSSYSGCKHLKLGQTNVRKFELHLLKHCQKGAPKSISTTNILCIKLFQCNEKIHRLAHGRNWGERRCVLDGGNLRGRRPMFRELLDLVLGWSLIALFLSS